MEIKAFGSFPVARPTAATASAVPRQTSPPPAGDAPPAATAAGSAASGTSGSGTTGSGTSGSIPGIYISPVLRYDQTAKLAVLFFRDGDTGETKDQIPAERVVEQYRRAGGRTSSDGLPGEEGTAVTGPVPATAGGPTGLPAPAPAPAQGTLPSSPPAVAAQSPATAPSIAPAPPTAAPSAAASGPAAAAPAAGTAVSLTV